MNCGHSTDIPLQINSGLGDDTIRIGKGCVRSLTAIDAFVTINAFPMFSHRGGDGADRPAAVTPWLINGRNDANASSYDWLIDPRT